MTNRSRRDPLAAAVFRGFSRLVRQGLRGIWWRGEPPAGPFVWAANHHSWWDPFVAAELLHRLRRVGCLLMSRENMDRYRFTRRLGGFDAREHRRGLAYLRAGRVLVIYPEGELLPAGELRPLADGAGWFARTARVPLYGAATRVLLRGQQAPEAYVSLVPVAAPASTRTRTLTTQLTSALRTELATLDARNAQADPRAPLPGFRQLVAGRRSWDERIDQVTGWLPGRST